MSFIPILFLIFIVKAKSKNLAVNGKAAHFQVPTLSALHIGAVSVSLVFISLFFFSAQIYLFCPINSPRWIILLYHYLLIPTFHMLRGNHIFTTSHLGF